MLSSGESNEKKFQSDDDRKKFITQLSELIPESKLDCYAWAFLPNHGHFLLKTASALLSVFMSRLLTGYVGWFNKKHRRHGQLFQNRYKSILCQQYIYLKELVCYIHLNPFTFFSSPPFRKYINSITHIGTISHYTIEQAKSTPIHISEESEEQSKIGNLFKQLDTLITEHQTQLKKLCNIKQACLEKMFI